MDIKTVPKIHQFIGLFTAVILASIFFIVFVHLEAITCHLKLCDITQAQILALERRDGRFDALFWREKKINSPKRMPGFFSFFFLSRVMIFLAESHKNCF